MRYCNQKKIHEIDLSCNIHTTAHVLEHHQTALWPSPHCVGVSVQLLELARLVSRVNYNTDIRQLNFKTRNG